MTDVEDSIVRAGNEVGTDIPFTREWKRCEVIVSSSSDVDMECPALP